jgi:hypothetical protein
VEGSEERKSNEGEGEEGRGKKEMLGRETLRE